MQLKNSVSISGDHGIVRNNEKGYAAGRDQAAKDFYHLRSGSSVEISGGFVGEEELRRIDQRPCKCHSLCFSPGELVGIPGGF
jgi:hypothetical protein